MIRTPHVGIFLIWSYSLFVRAFAKIDQSPRPFIWGVATAAYQIEGAVNDDGRGSTIWDIFSALPGKTSKGDTGKIADGSYYRIKEDVQLIKNMGLKSYRFSIAWSRILPTGQLPINQAGVDHYNALLDELERQGIEALVTLYHWDLPSYLEEKYNGWLSTEIEKDFTTYADVCFAAFGDRVKMWTTINEPWTFCLMGYVTGAFAPGRCSDRKTCPKGNSSIEGYIAAHNVLNSHAAAVQLYRTKYQKSQNGKIGIVLNQDWAEPLTQDPLDIIAANRKNEFTMGWFADPIVFGKYPDSMINLVGDRLPKFTVEEKKRLIGSYDYFAFNHYSTKYYFDPLRPLQEGEVRNTSISTPIPDSVPDPIPLEIIHTSSISSSISSISLTGISTRATATSENKIENERNRNMNKLQDRLLFDAKDDTGWAADQLNMESKYDSYGQIIGIEGASPWLHVVPWGFYNTIMWNYNRYKINGISPIFYITENGCDIPKENDMTLEVALNDEFRINYYQLYLVQMERAILNGVDIRGYYAWSLLDNYEWIDGFTNRFGLVYVDYKNSSLPRYPKKSSHWYGEYARTHYTYDIDFRDGENVGENHDTENGDNEGIVNSDNHSYYDDGAEMAIVVNADNADNNNDNSNNDSKNSVDKKNGKDKKEDKEKDKGKDEGKGNNKSNKKKNNKNKGKGKGKDNKDKDKDEDGKIDKGPTYPTDDDYPLDPSDVYNDDDDNDDNNNDNKNNKNKKNKSNNINNDNNDNNNDSNKINNDERMQRKRMEAVITTGGWLDYMHAAIGSNHGSAFYGFRGVVTI